jgi:hypothetical protein
MSSKRSRLNSPYSKAAEGISWLKLFPQPASMKDAFIMYWHAAWFEMTRVIPTSIVISVLVYMKFYQAENPEIASNLMVRVASIVQFLFVIKEVSDCTFFGV